MCIRDSVTPDLIQRTMKARGEFQLQLNNLLEPLKGRFGGVPKSVNDAVITGLRTGRVPQHLAGSTRQLRGMLDSLNAYMLEAGLDVGHLKNYFPQVWDVRRIQLHPEKFRTWLEETFEMDRATAENTFRNIVEGDGIPSFTADTPRYRKGMNFEQWAQQRFHAVKNPHAERSRKMHLPEGASTEWLVSDLEGILTQYIRRAAQRSEFVRTFGKNEETLNRMTADVIREVGVHKADAVANSIYNLADALQGTYKPIENSAGATLNSAAAAYETVTHLGLVALASLPETMAPAIQFGFNPKAYLKGAAYSMREGMAAADRLITGKRHIPHSITETHLKRMGNIIQAHTESMQAARLTNYQRGITNRFMKATLLEHLTNMQRVVAHDTMQSMIMSDAKHLSTGRNALGMKLSAKAERVAKRKLTELGIDPVRLVDWYRNGMPDGAMKNQIEWGIQRGITWTITHPNAATKPLWMSDPHWQQVSLFKSFTAVFSNTFLKRAIKNTLRENTSTARIQTIAGMVAAVALAYYVQYMREYMSGQEQDTEPAMRLADAVDRAAMTGSATHMYSMFSPYRYNYGEHVIHRFTGLLGPTLNDFLKLMHPIMTDNPEGVAKRLAKQTPILNITEPGREYMIEEVYEPFVDTIMD